MLTKQHGKNQVAKRFISHLSQPSEPLTNGKTSTPETISKWVKYGNERAEAETTRRANASVSGRSEAVPEVDKVWFQLMQSWSDFNKDKPSTSRYTTPPAHLVGKVALEYDKSAMMRIGREEKAAGDAIRDEAIETVAVARDSGREEKGPDNREHLKPRPRGQVAAAGAAPANGSESFMKNYVELEMKRFQLEEQRAKMDFRNAKLEEVKLYGTMLSGSNLDAAARARVTLLFITAIEKLQEMNQPGPGGDGGPGGDFTSPSKPSSSGYCSSASSSMGTPGSAGK